MGIIGEVSLTLAISVHHVDFPVPSLLGAKVICACASTYTINGVSTKTTTLVKIKYTRLYLRCICYSFSVLQSISYSLGLMGTTLCRKPLIRGDNYF